MPAPFAPTRPQRWPGSTPVQHSTHARTHEQAALCRENACVCVCTCVRLCAPVCMYRCACMCVSMLVCVCVCVHKGECWSGCGVVSVKSSWIGVEWESKTKSSALYCQNIMEFWRLELVQKSEGTATAVCQNRMKAKAITDLSGKALSGWKERLQGYTILPGMESCPCSVARN